MKTYTLLLKLTGQVSVSVKAGSIEEALEYGQSAYGGESVETLGTLKLVKGNDVDYTELQVAGVLE